MTGRTRKRGYHHGDLRRALIDATLDLAAEKSPAGVSLREAARAAGVSQTAPYRHFADKQAMLAAAAEEGFQLMLQHVHVAALSAKRPLDQLVEWTALYVQFAVEHPAHFRLMYGQGSPPKATTPTLQSAARETFQSFFRTVAQLPWGLDEPGLRALALQIWSLGHGLATLALDGQTIFLGVPPERAPDVARAAARAYLEGLVRQHRKR